MGALAKRSTRGQNSESSGFVDVGRIVGAFGLEGRVKVQVLTDFAERFDPGTQLYIDGEAYTVSACAWHKQQARVLLSEVSNIDQAEALIGQVLQFHIANREKLGRDQYYDTDLIGLNVKTEEGTLVGQVEAIVHAPAQDLLQVRGALIPMVKEFVKRVSLKDETITVALIPGMGPGDEAEEVR